MPIRYHEASCQGTVSMIRSSATSQHGVFCRSQALVDLGNDLGHTTAWTSRIRRSRLDKLHPICVFLDERVPHAVVLLVKRLSASLVAHFLDVLNFDAPAWTGTLDLA